MKNTTCLTWSILILILCCSLEDEDRCPKGFHYNSKSRTCVKNDSADSESTSEDKDDGSMGDEGVGQDATAEETRPSGLGEPCTELGDCAQYREDFCSYNDLAKAGYCTVPNCGFGECPSGYKCCDCSNSPMSPGGEIQIMCINDEQAGLAASVAGCTCE